MTDDPRWAELDRYLFSEGRHLKLWDHLGAHVGEFAGLAGVWFSVWAPSAAAVAVVGDFNGFDRSADPMHAIGSTGIWSAFVADAHLGQCYKYAVTTQSGHVSDKADPIARATEVPPRTASVITDSSHEWADAAWIAARATASPWREPMSIYEVHLPSWRGPKNYRDFAHELAGHVKYLGFTHVELLPVAEHPYGPSWGYQVSSYFAPTSRFGTPDDFRYLVDHLHAEGIGVIVDWVPAHFPKDEWALAKFDGTALYEHADPRQGEQPDWGTLVFNFGRTEVRNFLIANALYWLDEFHIDGLRVDAVASMLYLDYSRKDGEWIPNEFGGRENLEAVSFMRELNTEVHAQHPGVLMIAEESTAWPSVSRPVDSGGLGFGFKWNMGWMHDSLEYFAKDPIYRRFHQDVLTFAMIYEQSEHFIMPLSHDEMVHLKGSLYQKMPGDHWQKLANLRVLFAYMVTRPGKSLLFMGSELAVPGEWNHDESLAWHLAGEPDRAGFMAYMARLGHLYQQNPAFWQLDGESRGFEWIDVSDKANSVLSYLRRSGNGHAVVVLNLLPTPHPVYRIGVPEQGLYNCVLSSDARAWGGSGYGEVERVQTDDIPYHGRRYSLNLALPPLSALVLVPAHRANEQ